MKPLDHGPHDPSANYTPQSGKAELHLGYACDLECAGCNRASFLRKPHTHALTLDDAREFYRQARELNWKPRIVIIGGEPTMSHDFEAHVQLAEDFSDEAVQVFSNGYAPRARQALANIRMTNRVSVAEESFKRAGSVEESGSGRPEWSNDIFVSAADRGDPLRGPCYQHSAIICGISVDHEGYSPCAMGGMVSAILGVAGRTKVLADLFDRAKAAEMTRAICEHCGHQLSLQSGARAGGDGMHRHKAYAATLPIKFGAPMSPTWEKAFEGRR